MHRGTRDGPITTDTEAWAWGILTTCQARRKAGQGLADLATHTLAKNTSNSGMHLVPIST